MFDALLATLHKITFGVIGKPAPVADAQGKAPAPVGDSAEDPVMNPAAVNPAAVTGTPNPDLKSSTPGQTGGGRRRRRGSRGSRGSRRKYQKGGFAQGSSGQQGMGFGRAGGGGHRRSKKRNTHKRRK